MPAINNSGATSATLKGSKVIADSIEVHSDQEVEPIVNSEFDRTVSEEAFMNELLLVELHDDNDENAPPYAELSVNGVSCPLVRGTPTWLRRKFVEVLARCKETKYTQRTANPMEPDRIEMIPRTAMVYPFSVLEDPNPKGRAWLQAVKAEAN